MAAALLIYLCALALCLLMGAAASAVLRPRAPLVDSWTLPLGVCSYVVLAHWLGLVLHAGPLAVVAIVLAAGTLVAVALRARRRGAETTPAPVRDRPHLAALGFGTLAGVLFLAPLLSLGFPTTVAVSIADGWARSVFVEWLLEHALHESREPAGGSVLPLGTYSNLTPSLGAGFEYIAAAVATVLGRDGYQTVLPVAATAVPVSVCGWTALIGEITRRRPTVWHAAAAVVAATSPVFALTYADNYLTQFFSIALWPFALAAALACFRSLDVRAAAVGAVAAGAVAGVYPPFLPWLVPALLVAALVTPRAAGVPRLRAALTGLLLLGVAVLVLAPLELWRARSAVTSVAGLRSNPDFPLFQTEQDLGLVLGAFTQYDLQPWGALPPTGQLAPAVAFLVVALLVGAAATLRAPRAERAVIAGLGLAAGGVTLLLYWKYKQGDFYGYGAYKTLLSGGALLAGLLVVALAVASGRLARLGIVALALCLAVWLPVTGDLLERQRNGGQGFRADDRALGEVLETVPDDEVVLVEGMTDDGDAFRLRMSSAYFLVSSSEQADEGIGSTPSYIAGGRSPFWRPNRAWSHVLRLNRPSPFDAGRRPVWVQGPFTLSPAPELDVTPYAISRADERFRAAGGTWGLVAPGAPERTVRGPVELVVSNRRPSRTAAVLEVEVTASAPARWAIVAERGRVVTSRRLRPGERTVLRADVGVGARATSVVGLQPLTAGGEVAADAELVVHAVRVADR